MHNKKRYFFLFFILFTIVFYGYHVFEFGANSMISIMSLASCLSLLAFIRVYRKVGKQM